MSQNIEIDLLRHEYTKDTLNENDMASDPMVEFEEWLEEAVESRLPEPNAMMLATADAHGHPSGRMLLLKKYDKRGFYFFTHYASRKAIDIEANPHGALLFYWHELERQIRIEGQIEKVSSGESDAYFATRPKNSRIGAWSSPQSSVIPNRKWLDDSFETWQKQHSEADIPRPENWGGYILIPDRIEFWQGRPSRLHDRIEYLRQGGNWIKQRLAP